MPMGRASPPIWVAAKAEGTFQWHRSSIPPPGLPFPRWACRAARSGGLTGRESTRTSPAHEPSSALQLHRSPRPGWGREQLGEESLAGSPAETPWPPQPQLWSSRPRLAVGGKGALRLQLQLSVHSVGWLKPTSHRPTFLLLPCFENALCIFLKGRKYNRRPVWMARVSVKCTGQKMGLRLW